MSGLFSPKQPAAAPVTPVVNPADTANRMNDAMAKRLAAGGSSSTLLSQFMAGASGSTTGGGRAPTVTGNS